LILTTPIPVTGAGEYDSGFDNTTWSAGASGALGSDSAYFNVSAETGFGRPQPAPPVLGAICCGSGRIDDISSNFLALTIGLGDGNLSLFGDPAETMLLARTPLVSWISVTSIQISNSGVRSVFLVTATPEPWSLALTGAALAIFAAAARRRPRPPTSCNC
jgi:hypothetical protein